MTDEGKIKFVGLDFQDVTKPGDCLPVHQIATNAIYRIGRVDDDTTLFESLDNAVNFTLFGVFWMNG